ncbi:MAG: hypothetical protein IJR46_00815, partial [Neisseriaceae bacterium]|nr:hypothetical protein [Neisseriaceae bacterium]
NLYINSEELYINNDNGERIINTQKTTDEKIDILNISYFDHWLSDDKFVNAKFTCYQDAENANIETRKEIEQVINNFISVYEKLFILNNGIIYSENCCQVEKTDNIDLYYKWVLNGLKERPLARLLFVNLKTYIEFGYDLTHTVYVKNNKKITYEIKQITQSCCLNIIT